MIQYSEKVKFADLDKSLQKLLSLFDKACPGIQIATSGRRTQEHNAQVGGVQNSSHIKGLALDLSCTESQMRYTIVFSALAVGFKRIGLGDTFIHLDCDPDKPQNIIFNDIPLK